MYDRHNTNTHLHYDRVIVTQQLNWTAYIYYVQHIRRNVITVFSAKACVNSIMLVHCVNVSDGKGQHDVGWLKEKINKKWNSYVRERGRGRIGWDMITVTGRGR